MKISISTKKTGAGHYTVCVTLNDETKFFETTDASLIDDIQLMNEGCTEEMMNWEDEAALKSHLLEKAGF